MANQVAVDVELAWPYIQRRIERYLAGVDVGSGGSSGATVGEHALDGPLHSGSLARSQAPWVATDISSAIASHAALPDVHHARQHSVTSTSDHTITGAALSVVGATALNTLGLITPSANPGTTESILKATAGLLTLPQFTATTKVVAPHYTSATSFTSGFTGAGVRLDDGVATAGKTTLELDEMIVRGRMRVYELLIHQIRATNGSVFVTGVGKVKTVTGTGPYTITTDTDHGFATNDLIRAQRFSGVGVWQSNLQVTAVASTTQFTATLSSGDAPAIGMDYVRLGNTSDTSRQGSIYLTADDTYAPYIDILDGVTSFATWGAADKIKVRLGRLEGITDAALNPSGYGLYASNAYLKGAVSAANDNVRLDSTGVRVVASTASAPDSLNAYRFEDGSAGQLGGMFANRFGGANLVRLRALGDAARTAYAEVAAIPNSAQNVATTFIHATNAAATKEAYISLSATATAASILLQAADYIQFNPETRSSALHRPLLDLGANLGSATFRWGTLYANQVIATTISGATMSGAEWEYAGSMVIDANSGSNTTVTVANQGAGAVTFNVEGTLQQSGTAVSLAGHTHDDRYYTETELNAGQLNTLYYTETEVNSLLTGYVPTSRTVTAGSGLSGGGALSANITLSHADTSSQASVDNSGVNFIQDITLDTYGHVTAIGTASVATALSTLYLGATSAGGTLDWNDVSNTRPNSGFSIMRGSSSANAPTGAPSTAYYHPLNFEYSTKDGSGNVTQLAIPYSNTVGIDAGIYMRGRYASTWSNWAKIISENTAGNVLIGSNTDSGYKLSVTGTARVTGILYAGADIEMTGQLLAANGTAGSPGIAGVSDTNTGIYWSAADTLAVTTGGSLRATFNSTGVAITGSATASTSLIAPAITTASGNLSINPAGGTTAITGALTVSTTATVTTSVATPLLTTASGNLEMSPAGDLILDPVGNDVLPELNYDINLGAISKKYLTLHAAELWVETLVAQETIATIGGRILVGPTTTLEADLSTGATSIIVKHNSLNSGDRMYMEVDGKLEWMAITSAYSGTGPYTYTVTRNLDGTGANQWYAGDAVFNTGQAGNGFIDIYSLYGIPRNGQTATNRAGPTIVGNVRLSSTYNDFRERWAVGSLNGLYDYSTEVYGFAAGDPTATWVGLDATNGLRMMSSANKRLEITPAGVLNINNSAGAAVITLDNSGASFFAGAMTIGANGGIYQGTGTFASPTTGLKLWNDSGFGRLGGYNAGTLQWYVGTDGKFSSGDGRLTISSAGGIRARITNSTYDGLLFFNNDIVTYPAFYLSGLNAYYSGSGPGARASWYVAHQGNQSFPVQIQLQADSTTAGSKIVFSNAHVEIGGNISSVGTVAATAVTVGGTAVSLSGHTHDDRYYTETELNAGQLNTLYYTEAEVNSLLTGYVPTSRTVTAGSGLSGGGALSANITLNHADTSSQASVDNSGGTVIQDITLDTYGHITAIGSLNLDSRYYTETESDALFLPLAGGTLTGTVNSRAIIPVADNAYDIGSATNRVQDLYVVNLVANNIIGTPSFGHIHDALDITTGTLDEARLPHTYTSAVTMDADSVGTSNYIRWLTQVSTGKAWDLVVRAHDYATTPSQQNDLLLTYYDGSTIYMAFQADSATRVVDFAQTPTVGGTAVSLSGHTHDDRYYTEAELNAGQLNSLYYTETEVNSLLTGYVPTSRTVTAGGGLSGGGALSANITLSHADTSSQASVDNSGVSFIQDITLDTYGHVTAIGTASISSALDATYANVSGDTMTGQLVLPTAWTLDTQAITRGYSIAKGMNLVANGSGLLATNYNFSSFTFDAVETHGGGGSFSYTGAASLISSDEYVPVDIEKYYRLVFWAKSGNVNGSNYDAANKHYVGIYFYDADKNTVRPWNWQKATGDPVDTTLAAQLNPGDTTASLTSATNWYNSTNALYRHFAWWPYTNALGFTYPSYTYTRNHTVSYSYSSGGAWASGGISGTTITLAAPWPGPTLPAGTAVRNATGNINPLYLHAAVTVPNAWTRYESTVGSTNNTGVGQVFGAGTAYVRLLFWRNYTGTATSNIIRFSDIWFSELSSRNLEVASSTVPGVIALADQQLGTGNKWTPGRFGVGMSSAPTTYTLDVTGTARISSDAEVGGQLLVADGTLGALAWAFDADTDNGVYRSASNTWSLVAGGVASLAILNTGVLVNGTLNSTGAAFLAADTNTNSTIGRAIIGYAGGSDQASFAHVDHNTATNYALNQNNVGATILNGASAQTVSIALDGTPQWTINSDRLLPRGDGLMAIGDYNRKVKTLDVAELRAQTLVAREVVATVGGELAISPTTSLIAAIDAATGAPGGSSLYTTLTSYWRFEETSGTREDSKGSSDLSGASVGYAAGKQGNAASFGGTSSCGATDNSELSVGDIDWYGACWFYCTSDNGGLQTIAAKGDPSGSRSWAVRINWASGFKKLYFDVWNAGQTQTAYVEATTFGTLSTNTWYFAEWWHNATTNQIGLAVNRTQNTASFTYGTADDTGDFTVGQFYSTQNFIGRIDELGLWKTAIPSSTDRDWLYNSGAGRTFSDIYTYGAAAINVDVKHNFLRNGEFLLMKSAPGGIQQQEMYKITSGATSITGGFRYTAMRDQDVTGTNNWYVGDAVMSIAKDPGEGYIWQTAVTSPWGHEGPTSIYYVRTSSSQASDIAPVVAVGNLRSFVDYSIDEFGFAAGNNLTWLPDSASNAFRGLTVDKEDGARLFNTDIAMYNAGTQTVYMAATGQNFWMGPSSSDKRFSWNGTTLALKNSDITMFSGATETLRITTSDGFRLAAGNAAQNQIDVYSGSDRVYGQWTEIDSGNTLTRFDAIGKPGVGMGTLRLRSASSDGADSAYVEIGSTYINLYGKPVNVNHGLLVSGVLQAGVTSSNIAIGSGSGTFGGGAVVVFVANATTVPTTAPTGGGILYAQGGAGKWHGSSGTVTTFGTAEPHCPACGADYMTEFDNAEYGYFAICLKCLADELGSRQWILRGKTRLPTIAAA